MQSMVEGACSQTAAPSTALRAPPPPHAGEEPVKVDHRFRSTAERGRREPRCSEEQQPSEPTMQRLLVSAALAAVVAGLAVPASAGTYRKPFEVFPSIAPASPETMPTWSADELSGTARHNIAATPGCGAASPQGGIPSMATGTCP